MRCPQCSGSDTRVLDTRTPDERTVKRRRQCATCGFRFSTAERPVREEIFVRKRCGGVEEFDRQKIAASVQCALKKGPCRKAEVDALVDEIIAKLLAENPKCVSTDRIGDEVLRALRRFDEMAYVRYLSVHRAFANLSDFRENILGGVENDGDTV
ncbi:MAG: hypothetical protein LBI39_02305 [Puniceicoccales bacterium]|jgi:transcriptional repressor NrdR|nr:hypothetical protein [Puniceicoccales bacterium]